MYKTISSPDIMAYLPPQSLKLIDDFDDFAITFKEGTRRLIYCIQKLELLKKRRNIEFEFVETNPMLKALYRSAR